MIQTTDSLKAALKASEILNEYGALFTVDHIGIRHISLKVLKQPAHLGDVVFVFKPEMTKREIRKIIESDKSILRDITAVEY